MAFTVSVPNKVLIWYRETARSLHLEPTHRMQLSGQQRRSISINQSWHQLPTDGAAAYVRSTKSRTLK
jgi:hypothetical protein